MRECLSGTADLMYASVPADLQAYNPCSMFNCWYLSQAEEAHLPIKAGCSAQLEALKLWHLQHGESAGGHYQLTRENMEPAQQAGHPRCFSSHASHSGRFLSTHPPSNKSISVFLLPSALLLLMLTGLLAEIPGQTEPARTLPRTA